MARDMRHEEYGIVAVYSSCDQRVSVRLPAKHRISVVQSLLSRSLSDAYYSLGTMPRGR